MQLKDFYYELPKELIAQSPLEKRDMSRLLVLDRKTGKTTHLHFRDIKDYLNPGDCLVINNTRVIPARLLGVREDTGGKIEFVLLKKHDKDIWEVMLKPGRRAKVGTRFVFGDNLLKAEVLEIVEGGNRIVKFTYDGIFEEVLDKVGIIPLPPYITQKLKDRERYQTVYSKYNGSAAAPTAGLHFTEELIEELKNKGVRFAEVTLHVGIGTFRPVKTENIEDHKMHSEYFKIDAEACNIINKTRNDKGRVIAVGTTSCRVLESVADENGFVRPTEGETDIFIYPGYKFKAIDGLITNFHLPESTLLMLVSAFAGREKVLNAYKEAIELKYRFYSFGDAMFII
ncbi:S-adenosylmethionine:tRNA ribosyltransferase-isomerase [Thermoclostridium stercorarium subsp. thermolacticum DSM 2910]|nr:tRNA preQ1(34) S-adenosylmethionine ribosyltransferase-isomerase QueA [Thermoclostridium stercorarium]ANX00005.1 S-adenosylmethionine:tRNA ribosyltransferase-isomerase [Thermoclostridium stercorarium subsp. thermolacticum DSM 2910]ANX02650.1 S-adenosylmethionine:tRNA ribosyltransferase-isomerase [Thermoclostridium stercorarium subsp. leptospartum DSM 9219]UZQ86808.1 tRNA preQ1(34) S-adenosylmethionine ribosyltransferase-isomerase QueA [Thermoclostridium stercorarium]